MNNLNTFHNLSPTQAPRDGLVGEWLLDGNANDTSGNGNDGTATNVTWSTADRGYVGEVGSFNGSSSFINVTDSSLATLLNGRNPFSISVSINLNSLNAGQIILDTRGSDFNGFFIELDGDSKLKSVRSDGAVADTLSICNDVATTGTSCILTITYDGTNGKMYRDGVEQTGGISTRILNSNGDFKIGKGFAGNISFGFLNGKLGLIRIYNKALSQSEINDLELNSLR